MRSPLLYSISTIWLIKELFVIPYVFLAGESFIQYKLWYSCYIIFGASTRRNTSPNYATSPNSLQGPCMSETSRGLPNGKVISHFLSFYYNRGRFKDILILAKLTPDLLFDHSPYPHANFITITIPKSKKQFLQK